MKRQIQKTDNTPTINTAIASFRMLLEMVLKQEQAMLSCINAEMKHFPKGSLYVDEKPDGKAYFSMRKNSKKQGITENKDLVYKLARKKYLSIVRKKIEHDISANKKVAAEILAERKKSHAKDEDRKIRDLLEQYAKAGLDITRITMSEEQYRWMNSSYYRNKIHPEELIYETYSGVLVRSKSERTIGNELELYGIPYRYEQAWTSDVYWMLDENGEPLYTPKSYYPDFTILTITGEYIIWEHLGRVDLYGYRAHTMEKICAYRQNTEVDFRHLILTFENDLASLSTLDEIIKTQVLALGV